MQIFSPAPRAPRSYRERLTPSLKVLAGAAIVAPMVALVFVQYSAIAALALGIATAVLLVAALIWAAPVVRVEGGELRAGRAHIDLAFLGEPIALTGSDAAHARGAGLDPRGWYLLRGGIGGVVIVPITDPDDPVRTWTLSTRTPDRLAAAIRRARGV
ncbi:DUF3093 domain-containing protein [Microbacterium excoecariae]|uniref:DUF3093 domain-containing protein n=1 Tax=Microbacterium excoecariae TaxID=2715210 RepID=UPI00140C2823|nr:DUF3093 domain-containing protein [Microbacterium excoecariae]NHI17170.1 DUF3093 domain-containing protein [Microbacterium excoecariae]